MMKIQATIQQNRQFVKRMLLAIVVFATFFVNNRVLVPDIMESRNLVTAREMVEKGNWLVPTMNDELRLEKPPLPTWVSAVIEAASPDDIALQRTAAGLMGCLLLFYFYRFSKRTLKIDPVWAALILCTCYNFMLMGRTVSWDIYCHAFMMGGIYYFASAVSAPGRQIKRFLAAGLMTGLSIMSKGPVSLFALLLPMLLSLCIYIRPSFKQKWGGIAAMTATALIIGGWWFLYVHIAVGQELHDVIAKESGSWMNRNVRPWYYYHKFYLEAGIWAVLLITSVIMIAVNYRKTRERAMLMPMMWMIFGVILLSLMPEKKTRYLFPVLIPAAMMMGQMIELWKQQLSAASPSKPGILSFRINCWLLVPVALAAGGVAIYVTVANNLPAIPAIATTLASALAAIGLAKAAIRLMPGRMVWLVAMLFTAAECFAMPLVGRLINNPDMHGLEHTVGMEQLNGLPFMYNEDEEMRIELVYAARRDIRPIDLNDTAAILDHAPFVLLSHGSAAEALPAAIFEKADTVAVGRFDCNRRPKGTRRYSTMFIYNLTIIKAKESCPGAPAKIGNDNEPDKGI